MTTSLPHLLTLADLQVMDLLGMRRAEACRRALEERGVDRGCGLWRCAGHE